MAMIKCPNCNEKISDKSPKCVKCGYCFTDENKIKCEECGTLINCNAELCPNCGCPVKVTVQKKEKESGKNNGYFNIDSCNNYSSYFFCYSNF